MNSFDLYERNEKLFREAKKRKSRIHRCIGYLIIFLLAAATVILPVIMVLMKRPSVYRVTHQSTIKPGRDFLIVFGDDIYQMNN